MKTAMVLVAGVMIASTALVGQNDPATEERYRMKYGRHTPAEAARRNAVTAADAVEYLGQACCRHMKHETSTGKLALHSASREAWFKLKYGRGTPAAEARQRSMDEHVATHVRKCEELGRCPLVAADIGTTNTNLATASGSRREATFRAKYGRSAPSEESRAASAAKVERLPVAASHAVACEMECCKQTV
jgi:hypothetical protein